MSTFSNTTPIDNGPSASAFDNEFEDQADNSHYESLDTQPEFDYGDITSFNAEEDPKQRVLRSRMDPIPVRKNNQYLHNPTPYQTDVLSIDKLRSLNEPVNDKNAPGGKRPRTWRESLDLVKHPDTYCAGFMCQMPLDIHNPAETKFADLTFTLPSGCENVVDFVKTLTANDGALKLTLSPQQLTAAFGKVPNLGRNDWSIIPYTIRLVELHANLPDDFSMQLTTATVSKNEARKGKQHWIRNSGSHNCCDASTAANSAHSHIVYRDIHRVSSTDAVDLFIAPDHLYNSGDFYRWLNADEDSIWQEFKKSQVKNNPETLHVQCGPDDMIRCATVLQGLVQSEHAELCRLSKKFNHPGPAIVEDEHSNSVHAVSAKAVEQILNEAFDKIDKDKIKMRLEEFSLTLAPLRSNGRKGLFDLKSRVNKMAEYISEGRPSKCYFPDFMARIQIAYTLCDHQPRSHSVASAKSKKTGSKKAEGIYSMPEDF